MGRKAHEHKTAVHDGLHPFVYRGMVALTAWLVLSVWLFFGRGAYVGLTLAVITVFFIIVVGIPVLIWLTWQRNAPAARGEDESLRGWLADEFRTWTGAITGREAAMQILLPLAAVSIGMTVFGLVFYLDVPHAGY